MTVALHVVVILLNGRVVVGVGPEAPNFDGVTLVKVVAAVVSVDASHLQQDSLLRTENQ